MKNRTVQEVMTRDVVAVQEEENLSHILENMERYRFRHMPVVNGNKLVGLISQRDLLRLTTSGAGSSALIQSRDRSIRDGTFAASVMITDLDTVQSSTLLLDAVRVMVASKHGCIPVVTADGVLEGIITEQDMLKVLCEYLTGLAP